MKTGILSELLFTRFPFAFAIILIRSAPRTPWAFESDSGKKSMSQAVKRSSPTFIWWAIYVAVFIPLLFFRVAWEIINPVFDGWGDWAKAVGIMLFLCVIINAPTANIATSCIGHPKDAKYAAKWSALIACGLSLALWLIVAGLHLFWLSVLYALVTGITVGVTVHRIARKIQAEQ